MRSSGSGLGSGPSPGAIERASWRAASQLTGPCCWKSLARSPNSGIPLNGVVVPEGIAAIAGETGVAHPGHGRSTRGRIRPRPDRHRGQAPPGPGLRPGRLGRTMGADGRERGQYRWSVLSGEGIDGRSVVVTGAASAVGRQVVARLRSDATVARVVAIDEVPPLIVGDAVVEVHRMNLGDPELKTLVAEAGVTRARRIAGRDERRTACRRAEPRQRSGGRAGPARRGRVGRGVGAGAAVERHGLRRVGVEPAAADRGGTASPRSRFRLRGRAGRGRAVGHGLAPRPPRFVGRRPARRGGGERRVRGLAGAASPWSAAALRARPAPTGPASSSTSTTWPGPSIPPAGPGSTVPSTWPPTVGCRPTPWPSWPVPLVGCTCRAAWATRIRAGTASQSEVRRARPPGAAYTQHPWVVANDRLRATGWEAHHRNEEVYVETDEGGPLASMSARRRQELSLAGAAVALGAVVGAAVWLLRRHGRSRRASA